MSLGIIPELEEACTPREGEFVVVWVDSSARHAGLAAQAWTRPLAKAPWSDLRTRLFARPGYPPSVGDIVRIAEDA